jgi:hypothetical protein
MPIMLVNAEENGIRYEFTIWATPMPDVKDWQKAFDWPTEGENFTVWIRYKAINTSSTRARAKLYIRIIPEGSAGTHYVDKFLNPGESVEGAARFPFYPLKDPAAMMALLNVDYHPWLQRTIDYWE